MPLFRWNSASTGAEIEHTTGRRSSDRLAQLEDAFVTLSEAVGRTDASLRRHSERLDSLDKRDIEQQKWNAECQSRVTGSQSGVICPGCGNPADAGTHGVFCFTEETK